MVKPFPAWLEFVAYLGFFLVILLAAHEIITAYKQQTINPIYDVPPDGWVNTCDAGTIMVSDAHVVVCRDRDTMKMDRPPVVEWALYCPTEWVATRKFSLGSGLMVICDPEAGHGLEVLKGSWP